MTATDSLVPVLKRLKLSGLLHTLELRARQAVDDRLSYPDFLCRLLSDEAERREAAQLDQRLRRACFQSLKSVEEFDWHFNPQLPKERIIELCTCSFVAKKEAVLLIGPAGVGKSHIAQALGQRACRAGFSVLYTEAADLFAQLRASRADNSYERLMYKWTAVQLLLIDDLGLRPLSSQEAEDLYALIRRRYEHGALVLTSNRAVTEWGTLFGDALLASAAMDRLLHHAHVVVMDGPSYRTQRTAKRKGTQQPDSEPVSR